jgi:hypothetical protein
MSAIRCNASDSFFARQSDHLEPDLYVELFQNLYNFLPDKLIDSIRSEKMQDSNLKVNRYINSDI